MRKIFLISGLIFGLFAVSASAVYATPRFYFDPSSGDQVVGDSFEVVVKIDTGEEEASAADAAISFDATRLKVNQVVEGDFFPEFSYEIDNSEGRVTLWGMTEVHLEPVSGEGDLGTITFEAQSSGEASASFLCEDDSSLDSGIWDPSGNNLIDCASNGSGSYSIGGQSEEEDSTTTTESTTESTTEEDEVSTTTESTATASELPEAGVETPLIILGVGGIIMLLLSTVMAF